LIIAIDATHYEFTLAFGSVVPEISTLASIYRQAERAAVGIVAALVDIRVPTDPKFLDAVSPLMPPVKAAVEMASRTATVTSGVSIGVSATGPMNGATAANDPLAGASRVMVTFTWRF
jgi:hypothetical protein